MRLTINCGPATLAGLLLLFTSSAQLSAQQQNAILSAGTELPEAPQAQSVGARENSVALQSSISQNAGQAAPDAVGPEAGGISGTVTDVSGDVLTGVTVVLDGPTPGDHRTTVTNDNGGFAFEGLKSGTPYRVSINASGFSSWTSATVILAPGQHEFLTDVKLKIEGNTTSITVYSSTEQIAVEQVRIEEQQRVLGFIPNFYVVYDSKNAVPLTTKLKFTLAMRVSADPVTLGGIAFLAGINQAADTPNYVQGAKGYGQRIGTVAADGFSDILIGGAILPSLLRQDPRYFYQGTGSTRSRLRHAFFSPFICKGDNGRWQPNYSSIGGDLASSAISNLYYPESNRGVGLVFGTFAINTAERLASSIAQEFILPRFTPSVRKKH
jgi:hypothetical protein